MARRTKIIASIGPACDDPKTLRRMFAAGVDVARIGLAHGTLDEQIATYRTVRAAAQEAERRVGVLVDLPGPKVRCATFATGGVEIVQNDVIEATVATKGDVSTASRVCIEYEHLLRDIGPGDRLAFGDGNVVLEVQDRGGDTLKVRVVHGGHLEGRPGVHIASDRLSMPSPTENDLRSADAFIELGADMIAVSFVRSAHDMRRLGVEPVPKGPLLVAKIETKAAVENLEGIIGASGAVMVARGDLGSECDIEELPHLQKAIISQCVALGRPAITATQMLESLLHAPVPTRAEASDIANAVFDGTSAVMLSGETAIGHDPVNAVATMARITARADERFDYAAWADHITRLRRGSPQDQEYQRVTDALSRAAARVASDLDAAAILCLSRSGFTARSMARFRPSMPLLGITAEPRTAQQLSLSWGTRPLVFSETTSSTENVQKAVEAAKAAGAVRTGDRIVVVSGSIAELHATDTLRAMTVP